MVDAAGAVAWARMLTEDWVRQAAEAYAERLLSSAELLADSIA
jgi:hypothetical protein